MKKKPATTWEHKGVTIGLTERGEFAAMVGRKYLCSASLSGVKRMVNGALGKPLAPFGALRPREWSDKGKRLLFPVRVTGLVPMKGRRAWLNKSRFAVEGSTRLYGELLVDTKDNVAAYNALREFEKETARLERKREQQREKLKAALKYHRADEYTVKK